MGATRPERNFDHVEPKAVADLLREEQQLMAVMGKHRDQIKDVRAKRDALIEKERPKHEKELEKIDRKIEKEKAKKDQLYDKMQGVSRTSHRDVGERQKLFDHLKMASLDLGPLEREMQKLTAQRRELERRIKGNQTEADRLKQGCEFKSDKAIDHALRNIEQKEAKAREKGHEDVLRQLHREKQKVEGARDRVVAMQEKLLAVKEDKQKLHETDKAIQARTGDYEKTKQKHDELQQKKDKMIPDTTPEETKKEQEDRKALQSEHYDAIQGVKKQLDALHEEKRKILSSRSSAEVKALDEEINQIIAQRDKDGARLDEVKKQVPSHEVPVEDSDAVGALVGKGGATLQELQNDFGVLIDIKRGDGGKATAILIRGGNCQDAGEAVSDIMREAALCKHKEVMEFDPQLTREFIGAGGQHIQRLQTQSGATINLDRDQKTGKTVEGKVTIVGKQENVETAVRLIEEFKENNVRAVVEFSADMAGVIRGPLMKQWQEEYNCRSIRADQDARTIAIQGKAADVERAKGEIDQWLKDSKASKCEIRLGTVPPQVIIGRGGENVRLIQTETKTQINIANGRVQIMGAKDGTAKARQMVEKLIQENTRDEVKIDYKPDMFNFLIRPRPWPAVEGEEPRPPACLLEQIRTECECDTVRAMREVNKVHIRGKTDPVKRATQRLKRALEFKGQTRLPMPIDGSLLRHLAQRGKGRNAIDTLRDVPGMVEILTSAPKDPVQKMELIGSQEGVDTCKAKVEEMLKELGERTVRADIDQAKLRFVIGPGGATIRRIQEEFEVTLNVDNAASQVVIIADTKEKAEEAQEEVKRVVDAGGDTRFSGN
eukprot:TRINITY_DN60770_c0_g1_i1.p1 TRINITY_DN60770_c0_g1~~TRINITY_DN60770_c0_g1_i1.p1  ORF type:complete len:832 (+),score=356.68 TRINITY_DN60770_c0_g1_i1:98-2593(+)